MYRDSFCKLIGAIKKLEEDRKNARQRELRRKKKLSTYLWKTMWKTQNIATMVKCELKLDKSFASVHACFNRS